MKMFCHPYLGMPVDMWTWGRRYLDKKSLDKIWQFQPCCNVAKGGFISKSFSFWFQSPHKCAKNYPEHFFFRWIELKISIWPFFWRLEPKLSEIVPPLAAGQK